MVRAPVDADSLLFAEHRRDAAAALALQSLIDGQWRRAYDLLKDLTLSQRLPVYAKARRVAAYLAQQYDEVRDEPGARFALALDADHLPEEDLKSLLPVFAGDPRRRSWPGRRVAASRAASIRRRSSTTDLKWPREKAPAFSRSRNSGGGPIPGAIPRRTISRRGICSGRRRPRGWGGWRPWKSSSESAIAGNSAAATSARRLRKLSRERTPFRAKRAGARLPYCALRPCSGWAEVPGRHPEAKSANVARAHLIASAACLRLAERERRARSPKEADYLNEAMEFAERAAARVKDHPEALALKAAVEIETGRAASLNAAVERLTTVLDRIPDSVEARFHRATALHLLAEMNHLPSDRRTAAIDDLDRVLKAVPELASARVLRGIIRGSMGRYAESLEDLKAAQDSFPESDELKEWIRAAEAAKEK